MKGGGGGRKKYIKKYTKPVSEQGSLYGGGGKTHKSDCESIVFDTQLQKITTAAGSLSIGDELIIRNSKGELKAFNDSGNLCGSIVSAYNARIIECIGKGYSFIAIVKSVSGSIYIVTVQTT